MKPKKIQDDDEKERKKMEDDGIGMQKSPSKEVEEEGASASGGRGVINQFIYNMGSCEKGVSNGDDDETEHGTDGRCGGGGIFENLITNLTSPRTPKPNFFDGGGGVIDRLVSHISDNEAPATEEASVLMQSAIRD